MGKRTGTAKWSGSRWRIDVQKDGQRKSFYSSTTGRTGQREANAKADAWLDDGIANGGQRVEALYQQWLETVKLTTSESNWRPIESRWRIWIIPVIGSKKVQSLNEQHLQTVIDKAFAAGLSKKTLQGMCADLRAFCKYCRRCKVTSFFPEDLRVPAGALLKGKNILQPRDLVKLFNIDTTEKRGKRVPDRFINAYRFQVLTGLRPGELIGLRWADIHGRTVYIQRAINIYQEETQGKNQNAVRSFVLSDMARRVLEQQRAATGDGESVFDADSERQYYKQWQGYCASNGLTKVSLYELRHTFVSVVKTLPAGEVKQVVGHSADMDTFGIYGHELDGEGENTAQSINGIFAKLIKTV